MEFYTDLLNFYNTLFLNISYYLTIGLEESESLIRGTWEPLNDQCHVDKEIITKLTMENFYPGT